MCLLGTMIMISQIWLMGDTPNCTYNLRLVNLGVPFYCIILISCYNILMIMISRCANWNQLVTYSVPVLGRLKGALFYFKLYVTTKLTLKASIPLNIMVIFFWLHIIVEKGHGLVTVSL